MTSKQRSAERQRLTATRFSKVSSTFSRVALSLMIAAAGCQPTETTFEPRDLEGKVDQSLPKALQTRQETVARWLRGMQQGIGEVAGLRLLVPGVDMQEPFEKFYNAHQRLVRWEFGGQPQGNDVPVVLYFDNKESGVYEESQLTREERVYTLSGSGNRWTIARAKSEPLKLE